MKRLVVFTGAGISAESGIKTFRESGGLWENYAVEDIATPQAWYKNPELVLDFYNQRRKQVISAQPNAAHLALVELEKGFEVIVITQNIDDLHERAGSSRVVHLHGEIMKSRSSLNPSLIYPMNTDSIQLGDKCERGSQLRPHIVWFGESVPKMDEAIMITAKADIFLVIGTSLAVYPAASLLEYAPIACPKFIIDPSIPNVSYIENITAIQATAVNGMKILLKKLDDDNVPM